MAKSRVSFFPTAYNLSLYYNSVYMDENVIEKARSEMDAVIDIVKEDLDEVKTGRAKPSLVQNVMVEAYGTRMALIELATISSPDPQMLIIQPWDEGITANIEKAISTSDLNLNPVVDGSLIRIKIPPLTEERRQDLVKLVGQKLESGRVLLRQVRQDSKKLIEDSKGTPGVSEDDIFRLLSELEKVMDEYMQKVEELGEVKKQELMTI